MSQVILHSVIEKSKKSRRASPAERGVYTERSEVRIKIAELAERSEANKFSSIVTVRERREAAGALVH